MSDPELVQVEFLTAPYSPGEDGERIVWTVPEAGVWALGAGEPVRVTPGETYQVVATVRRP